MVENEGTNGDGKAKEIKEIEDVKENDVSSKVDSDKYLIHVRGNSFEIVSKRKSAGNACYFLLGELDIGEYKDRNTYPVGIKVEIPISEEIYNHLLRDVDDIGRYARVVVSGKLEVKVAAPNLD